MKVGDLVKYIGPIYDGLPDQGPGVILAKSYPTSTYNHPLQSLQVYWSLLDVARWQVSKMLEVISESR